MIAEIKHRGRSTAQRYKALEPAGTNEYAPRVGYYKVLQKTKVKIGDDVHQAFSVNWKQNNEDRFDEAFITTIQITSFARNQCPGSTEKLLANLIGRIIHVKSASKLIDGTKKFVVEWEILTAFQSTKHSLGDLSALGKLKAMEQALQDSTEDVDLDIDDDIDYGDY